MFKISNVQLKWIAALVWYAGSLALFLKGRQLTKGALDLHPESVWPYAIFIIGLVLGLIKTRYLFNKSAVKNIIRINELQNPRIWQFFRPVFFILLALMIATGAVLSRSSQGNFIYMLSVAILDFSLSIALALSGLLYWKKQ